MAIAFDASATSTANNDVERYSPTSWSHTVGSGQNRLLVVGIVIMSYYSQGTATGVTYNGVSMTKARADQKTVDDQQNESSVWILHNPDSGNHSVSVTWSGGSPMYLAGISASYTGCSQTSTADAVNGTTGTTTGAKTFTVTTIADNSWIFAVGLVTATTSSGLALTAGQTSRGSLLFFFNSNIIRGEDTNAAQTPAGEKSVGFTVNSDGIIMYCMSGASFAPVVSATLVPVFMNQYRQRRI